MTSTITEITTATLTGQHTSSGMITGIIVILLLSTLLVQKELFRAAGGKQGQIWRRTLNIAIIPLVIAFAVIASRRLIDLVT
jgi:multisubunit Na+/H+ antiporter MnhE subunit